MTDPTKRKMKMPAWHLPYLEKHNIYKLFYELARELVIQQPDDHVFFMKYLLTSAVKNIHIPHVIVLGSPRINLVEVATQISYHTKLFLITREMIDSVLKLDDRSTAKPSDIILGIQSIMNLNSGAIAQHGWILVDCITTKQEAQKLLDVGILPTHVLYLISPYSPKLTDLLYCDVTTNWPTFRRNMFDIVEVYKQKLIEIYLDDSDLETLVTKCVELICIEHIEKGPKQPRIVLIGPRGCGRKTQAKLLAEKLKIIYIDFEYLLCQEWVSESELGKQLRSCGDRACFNSALLTRVLNKRLLSIECLQMGWVLTGFPFTEKDLKHLDCVETPPNRVVFLECDLNVCLERLLKRQINVFTGSVTRLNEADPDVLTSKRLQYHPKDKADLINAELQFYCTQYGALRKYCGGTAAVVNADQPERWVYENILAAVMRDLPIVTPRDPFAPGPATKAEITAAMPYKVFTHD